MRFAPFAGDGAYDRDRPAGFGEYGFDTLEGALAGRGVYGREAPVLGLAP